MKLSELLAERERQDEHAQKLLLQELQAEAIRRRKEPDE
jgi:hypothetical protein